MKLEELITNVINKRRGFPDEHAAIFPQAIELQSDLQILFGETWIESEYEKKQEIGGNLTAKWATGQRHRQSRHLCGPVGPVPTPRRIRRRARLVCH